MLDEADKAPVEVVVLLSLPRTLNPNPNPKPNPKPKPKPNPTQETDASFRAVWDHWLLDSICTFQRQAEINYAVRLDEEEVLTRTLTLTLTLTVTLTLTCSCFTAADVLLVTLLGWKSWHGPYTTATARGMGG